MQTLIATPPAIGRPHDLPGDSPAWMKLADVAALLGLSPDLLLTAIDAGQLPLRTNQFGLKGLWFINAADVHRYRASLGAVR